MLAAAIIAALIVHCYTFNPATSYLEDINQALLKDYQEAAQLNWEMVIEGASKQLTERAEDFQARQIEWRKNTCKEMMAIALTTLNNTQTRQAYLMCRELVYSNAQFQKMYYYTSELRYYYADTAICLPTYRIVGKSNMTDVENGLVEFFTAVENSIDRNNIENLAQTSKIELIEDAIRSKMATQNKICLRDEQDFNKLMAFSKNELVLKWIWSVWREKAPPMKKLYKKLVDLENSVAETNGFADIGRNWRAKLEIPNLRRLSRQLYRTIKPLYSLLHGVVRFKLRKQYGDIVPTKGPIPAHLLGNLWSYNWESLADIMLPKTINLDARIKELNWTIVDMVKRAEDLYRSLGFPAMSSTFWRESVFARKNNMTDCHGAAADFYKTNDYRLIYCSGTTFEDLYVIHHEMGHIQYYMAYEHLPALFRQANPALHESIGDTIMLGARTPQHLHRLNLINDATLYSVNTKKIQRRNSKFRGILSYLRENNLAKRIEDTSDVKDEFDNEVDGIDFTDDDLLLLKTALSRIPHIPFALVVEEYRWKYFEGDIDDSEVNAEFWRLTHQLQGISPPEERTERNFDAGAIFHVADNTPYSRYFISFFLQHQIFEKLCKASVFGRRDADEELPSSVLIHRCDIYGSKSAGNILKDIMSKGDSAPWSVILKEAIGTDVISARALVRYYEPVHKLLTRLVEKYKIPIGW